jgi:hypothetical protein
LALGEIASLVGAGAALAAVYVARLTVNEARDGRKEAADAHVEAMASEHRLQQTLQLERVASLLRELSDVARGEQLDPPAALSELQPIPLSRLPSVLARLRVAINTLDLLGGPDLAAARQVAEEGHTIGTQPISLVGIAMTALSEVIDAQRRMHNWN